MLVTKWKTYSRKALSKILAFILLVVFLLIGAASALTVYENVKNYESITVKNYMKSNTLSNELRYVANRLEYVLRVYKSKDYILSGGTVNKLDIEDSWQLKNLYNNFIAEKGLDDSGEARDIFWAEKREAIEDIKTSIMKSDLTTYEQIMENLDEYGGLIYYAADGKREVTNTNNPGRDYYKLQNVYILVDEKGVVLYPENGYSSYSASLIDTLEDIEDGTNKISIYAAITEEGLLKRVEQWNKDRIILIKNSFVIALSVIIVLMCFVYLTVVAGRVTGDEEVHMQFIDRIYSDISLILIVGIVTLGFTQFYAVLDLRYTSENIMKFVMLLSTAVLSSLFLMMFYSIVRHIKSGTVVKHSFIYLVFLYTARMFVKIASGGPLMIKSMAAVIILIGTSYYSSKAPVLLIPLSAGTVYYVYTKVRKFQTVQEGLKVAKTGNYDYKIKLDGPGEFGLMAKDVNDMTSGLKAAVQNEVKSERLKTELITNVSHDIKTPLTSIISYVDLLKREGLTSANAPKYLDVLDRKSNRLKTLTEDLFEAAKATSGSIEPNFSRVNVNALISQILGELDEKVQESGLMLKVSTENDRIYARADGRLLSRVTENLLSNIFKYALKNSRVYIDIFEKYKEVIVSFKNISAHELNIPADELLERFKRGDESRSSEGSGLGLAIAKSLMEIQNGVLNIIIDGDLFKAEIRLSKFE
ncbi:MULTISPECIES: HAMP domain-containing sensor histidine kinase [unclassified Sedimentibacter]|uniref:HAMP domain-containing sensor histidine kinase n=1 Tax=unclassified Sedimentibacter TaxID=2649220 RepID=UPI0027DF63E5|nr:sensor histidine kinase [Sedimentibacter sp. MB35-C1]WMJ76786.1 sensor histidine kinase [Sedimentibacter sp. MB35-C1]